MYLQLSARHKLYGVCKSTNAKFLHVARILYTVMVIHCYVHTWFPTMYSLFVDKTCTFPANSRTVCAVTYGNKHLRNVN